MDDLKANLLTYAILFGGSQLFAFLLDLIKWAVSRKHPARIAKSEDVSYPQYLTVSVWHDSHLAHRYIEHTYIRKGNNKYKKYIRNAKFMKALAIAYNYLRLSERASDLRSISFLHYEQLAGTNGMSSIRVVNGMVERILFREFEGGIRIIVLSLDNTHYGNKK